MDVTNFPNHRPPTTGLRIEVAGNTAKLVGPRELMGKLLDLPWMNYITMDGEIHTEIHDPIPHNGAARANGALRQAREGRP